MTAKCDRSIAELLGVSHGVQRLHDYIKKSLRGEGPRVNEVRRRKVATSDHLKQSVRKSKPSEMLEQGKIKTTEVSAGYLYGIE